MAKKKFYVVWKGRENGVFSTWEDCRKQVEGFTGALYKSFETEAAASDAFAKGSSGFSVKADQKKIFEVKPHVTKHPVKHSIAVDGAWNTKTLDSEYRGVEVSTGKQLFIRGPLLKERTISWSFWHWYMLWLIAKNISLLFRFIPTVLPQ
ncbi:MAG: ribonuclease H family protein [Bacteroidia bacterium]